MRWSHRCRTADAAGHLAFPTSWFHCPATRPTAFVAGRSPGVARSRAKLIEQDSSLGQSPFGLDQALGHLAMVVLGSLQGVGRVVQLLLDVSGLALMPTVGGR